MQSSEKSQSVSIRVGDVNWPIEHPQIASIPWPFTALEDLAETIDQALTNPLDFPSIDQMIVAGDTVALAVDASLPQLETLVAELAKWLVEHGTPPDSLRVVLAGPESQVSSVSTALSASGLSAIVLERHNPDDDQAHSYLAADEGAQAIYLNRTLVDADVVLPISLARPSGSIDQLGSFGIFSQFTNRQTRGQLLNYQQLNRSAERQLLKERCDQAAWWLGVMAGVSVIPGAGDTIAAVTCGLLDPIHAAASELIDRRLEETAGFDLVVVTIQTPQADWIDVARAIHRARAFSQPGGSIAVCSQVAGPIGPSLKRLRSNDPDRDNTLKQLSKDAGDDLLAAGAVIECTRDQHLYLMSNHRADSIESLGIGVIKDHQSLLQLVRRHPRVVVIESAHYA